MVWEAVKAPLAGETVSQSASEVMEKGISPSEPPLPISKSSSVLPTPIRISSGATRVGVAERGTLSQRMSSK